jgi:hypothetical protein
MFSLFRTRIFAAVLAWFGIATWAETKLDPEWHWRGITSEPFGEWVKQVPAQLPVKLAEGLQMPVDYAVAELSRETLPWYVRVPAKIFGAAVLYALLLRFVIWRMRVRFGWAVPIQQRSP